MPEIAVLALGGTIAMVPGETAGVVPTLSADMLVSAVPALKEVARVRAESFRQVPGAHLSFDDLEALANAARKAVSDGAQGVVVTQGTDTIEETAFALDLLLDLDAPVIVTGAMRNPSLPGADGPANILAAAQAAVSAETRGLGVLVAFNDELHAAAFVRKSHTTSPATFVSPIAGALGYVVEGRVRVLTRPSRPSSLPGSGTGRARVALATLSLDDDGGLIDLATQAGYDGIVVEAVGGGHASPAAADAIERAARRMPVVLASRTGAGEVLKATYGFTGSEIDLLGRGAIRAGWLDGPKARVLLALALRRGLDRAGIEAEFAKRGGG